METEKKRDRWERVDDSDNEPWRHGEDGRESLMMGGVRHKTREGWEREKRTLHSLDDGGEVEDDGGGRLSVGRRKRESRGRSRERSEEDDEDQRRSAGEREREKARKRESREYSDKEAEDDRRPVTTDKERVRDTDKEKGRGRDRRRERDRGRDKERDRERDKGRDKDRGSGRERGRDREKRREREKGSEREGRYFSGSKRSQERSRDKGEVEETLETIKQGNRQLLGRDGVEHHGKEVSGMRPDGANGTAAEELVSGHKRDHRAEFAETKPIEKDADKSPSKHQTEGDVTGEHSEQLSGEKKRSEKCPRRGDGGREDSLDGHSDGGPRERGKHRDGRREGGEKTRREKRRWKRRRVSSSEESEYTSSGDSSEDSESESTSGSESYSSESDSESDSDEERERERRRRRKEKEKRKEKERKREKEREKRKREKKRKKEKKEKQARKAKQKKEQDKEKGSMRGAVTAQWGTHGLIKEIDMWKKRPEFSAWLAEVKKINLETLTNWEEKSMFKEYMEDYNTATLPSMKYYSLDAYHREEMQKAHAMGMAMVMAKSKERTAFNDEDERRQEIRRQRERQKEAEIQALKRAMQGGLAEAMREQELLREEMQYQYRVGNFEAATAIQKRLEPDQMGKF